IKDMDHAGSIIDVIKELETHVNTEEMTVTLKTIAENIKDATVEEVYRDIIKPLNDPLHKDGGIAVLKGNLAPDGSIIKLKAIINQELSKHSGKALVFTSTEDIE